MCVLFISYSTQTTFSCSATPTLRAHPSLLQRWFAPLSSWSAQDSPVTVRRWLWRLRRLNVDLNWFNFYIIGGRSCRQSAPRVVKLCTDNLTGVICSFVKSKGIWRQIRGPHSIPGFTCYAERATHGKTDMGDTGSEGSKPPSNVNVIPPRCPCGFWG